MSAAGAIAPQLVLFGGPAGAGKSTLATAWCATRPLATHLQLDHVRELIVSGRADPQQAGPQQTEQFALAVRGCCALARVFLAGGYDVAIDDVLEPHAWDNVWLPALADLQPQIVIVLPSLAETLRRSRGRAKRVQEGHTRAQHAASLAWPADRRIDTSSLDVPASLDLVQALLERQSRNPGGG